MAIKFQCRKCKHISIIEGNTITDSFKKPTCRCDEVVMEIKVDTPQQMHKEISWELNNGNS